MVHEYHMSSLFHESEVALANIGLGALTGDAWQVVVGELGLGYTAAAALEFTQLQRLIVVEAVEPVIGCHKRGLGPLQRQLETDNRCVFCHEDTVIGNACGAGLQGPVLGACKPVSARYRDGGIR